MSFESFLPYHSPMPVNENEKRKKIQLAKIQNLKFRQTLYNFGRDPPKKCAYFLGGVNLLRTFRGDVV